MTTRPLKVPVSFEVRVLTGDTVQTQPGVPRGTKRTGRFKTVTMDVYDRFEPTLSVKAPPAYVINGIGADSAIAMLRLHGIVVERLRDEWHGTGEVFTVDSLVKGAFSGQRATERVAGHWSTTNVEALAGSYVVRTTQPLGVLAVYLLEPESDDGIGFWDYFDPLVLVGRTYPVTRARVPVTAPAWIVP